MPVYPYNKEVKEVAENMNKGNFGLWYNKFIPVADADNKKSSYKACDDKGIPDNAVEFYAGKYTGINKTEIQLMLTQKHINHADFCASFLPKYEALVFRARLITPLITGIGETHPNEISMTFDHNTGIPYIPSSGIKGLVRFNHTLSLIDEIPEGKLIDEKDGKPCDPYFDDEDDWTKVKELFGTQKNRGSVIFLDAYPEIVPELHIDIMNPHYCEYYSDDTGTVPPGDYLNPVPIKFLTVAKETTFIFRAIVSRDMPGLAEKVKDAIKRSLTEEGVGAKTAIGYGLFDNLEETEAEVVHDYLKKKTLESEKKEEKKKQRAEANRIASLTEDEKMIEKLDSLIKDTSKIADLIKSCLESDLGKATYIKLKEKLQEIDEWKPSGSKQRKARMKARNSHIEAKIGS